MFQFDEKDTQLCFLFSSVLRNVDNALKQVQEFLRKHTASNITDLDIVIRELLVNAIEHGNQNIAGLTVKFELTLLENTRFKIMVEDQGAGFDHEKLSLDFAEDPRRDRRRGLPIVNALVDELRFEKNGARVIAFISMPATGSFAVAEENGWVIIALPETVSASNAAEMRELLLKYIERGDKKFRLDCLELNEIDSLGLSVLVAFANTFEANDPDKELELSNVSAECGELFRIICLDSMFRVEEQNNSRELSV